MSPRRRVTLRAFGLAAIGAAVIGAAVLAAVLWNAPARPRATVPAQPPATNPGSEPALRATVQRRAATEPTGQPANTPAATAPTPSFDDYLDRMVAFARELRDAVEGGAFERAREIDDRCRALVEALERDYPQAGDLSLFALGGVVPATPEAPGLRFESLRFLLARALLRLDREASLGDRGALDELVAKALDLVPRDPGTAQALAPLLATGSRLGLAHEESVCRSSRRCLGIPGSPRLRPNCCGRSGRI